MTRDLSAGIPETQVKESESPGFGAVADVTDSSVGSSTAEARDFVRWLERHEDELVRRWVTDATARLDDPDPQLVALLTEFYEVTLRLVAGSFGPLLYLLRRLGQSAPVVSRGTGGGSIAAQA